MKNLHQHHVINRTTRAIDIAIATSIMALLLPVWLLNTLISMVRRNSVHANRVMHDALDRPVKVSVFNDGIWRDSLILLAIVKGRLQFFGVSLHHPLEQQYHLAFAHIPSGFFSLYDLHQWLGLIDRTHEDALTEQSHDASAFAYCKNIFKAFLCYELYFSDHLQQSKTFSLFGIKINNSTLEEALDWVLAKRADVGCKVGFFVNVNSINIALKNTEFKNNLQTANRVFADGSGVRLAAAHIGEKLRANLNGTDLLPHICKAAIAQQKSIYLLGSAPGIAEKAAENLQNTYAGLHVAGSHHGYFAYSENAKIINDINNSGASICLIALGSPLQEQWLIENAAKLNCDTALAVGGLLDFFSAKIPRAPHWLRALGFEWVWRLIQEPIKKFSRYVIGNPVFLFRTYILNQARI